MLAVRVWAGHHFTVVPGLFIVTLKPGRKGGDEMPVTATHLNTRLQLRLRMGFDGSGNPIIRTRSYSNIIPTADNQDLFDTGSELASLQIHELDVIRRVDELELEEEV